MDRILVDVREIEDGWDVMQVELKNEVIVSDAVDYPFKLQEDVDIEECVVRSSDIAGL